MSRGFVAHSSPPRRPRRRHSLARRRRLDAAPKRATVVSSVALREHEPVVHQHVVGVQLVGDDDLHAVTEVAERLPHRVLVAVEHEEHPRRRARPRCADRAPRAARCAALVRGCRCPSRRARAPCPRRRGRTGPSAARGGSSSWACAGGSRAASGRAPHHRHASAARGSNPGGPGRCPSGATASHHRRATSARVFVLCVPERAAASWAVTTWCMTAVLGSMPNSSSGTSTVPASRRRRLHVELHAASPCAAGATGRFAAFLTNTGRRWGRVPRP